MCYIACSKCTIIFVDKKCFIQTAVISIIISTFPLHLIRVEELSLRDNVSREKIANFVIFLDLCFYTHVMCEIL